MKRISQWFGNLVMDYHWYQIRKCRRNAMHFIEQGATCSDLRLVRLSNCILSHGMQVSHIWRSSRKSYITCDPTKEVTV